MTTNKHYLVLHQWTGRYGYMELKKVISKSSNIYYLFRKGVDFLRENGFNKYVDEWIKRYKQQKLLWVQLGNYDTSPELEVISEKEFNMRGYHYD